jgi:hypothetical protein
VIPYEKYADQGLAVFPCYRNRQPIKGSNGFHDATTEIFMLREMFRSDNVLVGLPTGNVNGIVVIDFDVKKLPAGISLDDLIEAVTESYGELPETLSIQTQTGGLHLYYRVETTQTRSRAEFLKKDMPVDIRSNGGYVCAPSGNSLYTPIDVDEDIFWSDLKSLCAPLPEWIEDYEKEITVVEPSPVSHGNVLPEAEVLAIRSALSFLDPDDFHMWIRIGLCLKATNSVSAFGLWDEWSKRSAKYKPGEMEYRWNSFKPENIEPGSLFFEAKKYGYVSTYKNNGSSEISVMDNGEIEIEISDGQEYEKKPFPLHLLAPPGLVGDIVHHINKFSPKRQPILALGAALAAAGAVMGQRYQTDTGLRTNIYVLGIGESACGKDAARSAVRLLFFSAEIGELGATEDLASDAAIITELSLNPSQVFLIDEIANLLKAINSSRNSHLTQVASILLKLYSSANQVFYGKSYADSKNKKVIDSPNLCLYATTLPQTFFDALTAENITDGFMSRLLLFESEDPDPPMEGRRRFALEKICPNLVETVKAIHSMPRNVVDKGNVAVRERVKPRVVMMDGDAENLIEEFREHVRKKRAKIRKVNNSNHDTVYGRAPQYVEQIALIIAVGRDFRQPKISYGDVKYAAQLIEYLTDRMFFIATHFVSQNEHEAHLKKSLAMIRKWGLEGMTRSAFCRRTQFLKGYDREDVLKTLHESGQIVFEDNKIYPIKQQ